MKANPQIEIAVKDVLNKLAEGYAKRDWQILASLFAADPDVVMFGTGVDEKRIGLPQIKAQAERDWSQTESTTLEFDWTSVSSSDTVAWVAADVTFKIKAGGQDMNLQGRLTAVLQKQGEQWLIVQSHFSFPAANQTEGESFPK